MKKKTLLFLFSLFFVAALWVGNASGPGAVQGIDRTGGPIATGFCGNSGCHGGGSFGTTVAITLLDGTDTISEYEPGSTYTLQVSIVAEGAEGYGFQAVALDTADAGVGSFGAPGDGIQITNLDNIDYIEHSERSASSTFEIEWTAPESGAGDIGFFAAGNAVNADFSIGGDDADTASLVLPEAQSASLRDIASDLEISLAPNPTTDYLKVSWTSEAAVPQKIKLINNMGQALYQQDINSHIRNLEMSVAQYPPGIYFVQMISDQGIKTRRLMKN